MNKKLTYIIGTILCSILAIIAVILIFITSGKDSEATKIVFAGFAAWMIFGIYRGLMHLFSKPDNKPSPTFEGVKYNVTPIPNGKVIKDFFNPFAMRFRTVGSLFILCLLWVGMVYFSPKFTIYFWILLIVTIVIKGFLLTRYLRLNDAQNTLGKVILEQSGDIDVCRYDVTVQLINAYDTTPEHVIDPIRPYVNVSGSHDDYLKDISQFSTAQRHILAVNLYISDVYGDGHYGYFTDSVGMLYLDAIKGLKAIGANKYADILKSAGSEFDGINRPAYNLEQRVDIINDSGLDFESADDAIYSLDEYGEDIAEIQMAYIRSHVDDFLFDNPQKH